MKRKATEKKKANCSNDLIGEEDIENEEGLDDQTATEAPIKAACHYFIAKICEDESQKLGMRIERQTVAALNELFFGYAKSFASDLEHFARHAKRATIQPEDVQLCARRSPKLRELIARKANELALASEERKAQRQAARKKSKDKEADDTETFAEDDQHYDEQKPKERKRLKKGGTSKKSAWLSDEAEEKGGMLDEEDEENLFEI